MARGQGVNTEHSASALVGPAPRRRSPAGAPVAPQIPERAPGQFKFAGSPAAGDGEAELLQRLHLYEQDHPGVPGRGIVDIGVIWAGGARLSWDGGTGVLYFRNDDASTEVVGYIEPPPDAGAARDPYSMHPDGIIERWAGKPWPEMCQDGWVGRNRLTESLKPTLAAAENILSLREPGPVPEPPQLAVRSVGSMIGFGR